MAEPLYVVAAVISNNQGGFLLSQRQTGQHLAGCWEFPGGKREPGEPRQACLIRELQEELGITPTRFRPLIQVKHRYPEREVLLDIWWVNDFSGEASSREGQNMAWYSLEQIAALELPAADEPILKAMRLPSIYRISNDFEAADMAHQVENFVSFAEAYPGSLLQLRCASLSDSQYQKLIDALQPARNNQGLKLLINRLPLLQHSLEQVDGLHLPSNALHQAKELDLPTHCLLTASCHNAQDLAQAELIRADAALLSPVLKTASHPEATALGWDNFSASIAAVNMPVYALGGMKLEMLEQAWSHGAQGVAGIRF